MAEFALNLALPILYVVQRYGFAREREFANSGWIKFIFAPVSIRKGNSPIFVCKLMYGIVGATNGVAILKNWLPLVWDRLSLVDWFLGILPLEGQIRSVRRVGSCKKDMGRCHSFVHHSSVADSRTSRYRAVGMRFLKDELVS